MCEASPPFATIPVIFTRYSQAVNYIDQVRDQLSFVLAMPAAGVQEACTRIEKFTDLKAMSGREFGSQTIGYYLKKPVFRLILESPLRSLSLLAQPSLAKPSTSLL